MFTIFQSVIVIFKKLINLAAPHLSMQLLIFTAVCGIFSCCMWTLSCGMWNLVPRPGTEPDPLHWELEILATGPLGKSPLYLLFNSFWTYNTLIFTYCKYTHQWFFRQYIGLYGRSHNPVIEHLYHTKSSFVPFAVSSSSHPHIQAINDQLSASIDFVSSGNFLVISLSFCYLLLRCRPRVFDAALGVVVRVGKMEIEGFRLEDIGDGSDHCVQEPPVWMLKTELWQEMR